MNRFLGWMMLVLMLALSPVASGSEAEAPALGAAPPVALSAEPIEGDPICTPQYSSCTAIEDGFEVWQKPNGICILICYTIYECFDVACGDPFPIYERAQERERMGPLPPGTCPGMPDSGSGPLCRRVPQGIWMDEE